MKKSLFILFLIIAQLQAFHDLRYEDLNGNVVETLYVYETYVLKGSYESVGATAKIFSFLDIDGDLQPDPTVDAGAQRIPEGLDNTLIDGVGDQYGAIIDNVADGQLHSEGIVAEWRTCVGPGMNVVMIEDGGVTDTYVFKMLFKEKGTGYKGYCHLANGCPAYRFRLGIYLRGPENPEKPFVFVVPDQNGFFEAYFDGHPGITYPATQCGWSADNTMKLYDCPWNQKNSGMYFPDGEFLPNMQSGVVHDYDIVLDTCGPTDCGAVSAEPSNDITPSIKRSSLLLDNSNLYFGVDKPGHVELVVYNSKGALVSSLDAGIKAKGEVVRTDISSSLTKGMAIAVVKINNKQTLTQKLIIK